MAKRAEEEIAKVRQEAALSVTQVRQQFDETRALERAGIDDDLGMQTARTAYQAIPEATRPKTLSDWWGGLTDETTPKALKPYRKPAAETESGKDATKTTVVRQPPKVDENRGGKAKDPDWARMTADEYDAAIAADARALLTAEMK